MFVGEADESEPLKETRFIVSLLTFILTVLQLTLQLCCMLKERGGRNGSESEGVILGHVLLPVFTFPLR